MEIVELNFAFEKDDRLLEQKHINSQYDKNEQLTLLWSNANSHLPEEIC